MRRVTRSNSIPFGYRRDSAVPVFDDASPIIIFDGKCMLCSLFVQFVLRNDRRGKLRFLAAQAPLGEAIYAYLGLQTGDFETYVVLENGTARVKSDAALRIFALLGLPWSLMCLGRIAPRFARDGFYDWVARNRLRWFGARATCYVPTAAQRERFIA
jgi:predicted DCC family thiol-disulfide oxidoreductase YuxK